MNMQVPLSILTFLLSITKRVDKIECERQVREFIKSSAKHFQVERFVVERVLSFCLQSLKRYQRNLVPSS